MMEEIPDVEEDIGTGSTDAVQEDLTHIDAVDVASRLTMQEKKFCELLVFGNKNPKAALKEAGSKAKDQYLSKMAWEIQQKADVQLYIEKLKEVRSSDSCIELREVVNNARRAIEQAFALGKPEKVDPHNRLLAELGGFIKGHSNSHNAAPAATNTQININTHLKQRGEKATLSHEIHRLQAITNRRVSTPGVSSTVKKIELELEEDPDYDDIDDYEVIDEVEE